MTYTVLFRGSCVSEIEFPDFDPMCECTEEEIEKMREIYTDYICAALSEIDDSIYWQPETSEIFGSIDIDDSKLPSDWGKWWNEVSDAALEKAWEQEL